VRSSFEEAASLANGFVVVPIVGSSGCEAEEEDGPDSSIARRSTSPLLLPPLLAPLRSLLLPFTSVAPLLRLLIGLLLGTGEDMGEEAEGDA
jgi:hypothetical protein